MKISEQWLREWVNLPITTVALADQFTMAGLEVESMTSQEGLGMSFEINITPNRGDCLSALGLARELGVLNQQSLAVIADEPVMPSSAVSPSIVIEAPTACPRYVGRFITGIRQDAVTPTEIALKLQASDIHLVHPVVDILNYVMLELGQPMHAFDADKLQGGIVVRLAKKGESLTVLGGQLVNLVESAVVIADEAGPQAIAGIIGGEASAVLAQTENIFLESALFTMEPIAGKARQMGLHTDSSYRFERGVDPMLQKIAMERATRWIITCCGGQAGPVIEKVESGYLPSGKKIMFRPSRFYRVIGDRDLPEAHLRDILERLQCEVGVKEKEWEVCPPSFRYDLNEEVDLIEEIARIRGYGNLRASLPDSQMVFAALSQTMVPMDRIKRILVDKGYHEAITYSFVDDALQRSLFPDDQALALVNPISSEMAVMRVSTWVGLLNAVRYNQYRQQGRLKLFEVGKCFREGAENLLQEDYLGGVVTGEAFVEHWGVAKRAVDFYDVKGDVEALFKTVGLPIEKLVFHPAAYLACHPGQCAELYWQGKRVGVIGKLHPEIQQRWDIQGAIYLFEIKIDVLRETSCPVLSRPSRFPENRRDIAMIISEEITGKSIIECVKQYGGDLLREVIIFDVYQGKGIEPGRKSMAIGLILQHSSRTLVDEEVEAAVQAVVMGLEKEFNAKLRS